MMGLKWVAVTALALAVGCSGGGSQTHTDASMPDAPPVPGADWASATTTAAFGAREGNCALYFNNAFWVIAGATSGGTPFYDVWTSTDGASWTAVSAHAAFTAMKPICIVFDQKMWVLGGTGVWSSTDGVTWTQAVATPPFGYRAGATVAVFNNAMYLVAGYRSDQGMWVSDVWTSTDGITWTQATADAGFAARSGHVSLVYANKLWVLGGEDSHNGALHDVYQSSDGVSWLPATLNAAFGGRANGAGFAFNNAMWMVGGSSNPVSGVGNSDIWSSTDGATWTEVTSAAAFPVRVYAGATQAPSAMWLIGGQGGAGDLADAWHSL